VLSALPIVTSCGCAEAIYALVVRPVLKAAKHSTSRAQAGTRALTLSNRR
jgi:hypothetical protein